MKMIAGALRVSAENAAGEVRAIPLDGHTSFVATLSQPERALGDPAAASH
jgi:hypothetical protein